MTCKSCGAEYEKALFCPYCGATNKYWDAWRKEEEKRFPGSTADFVVGDNEKLLYARYHILGRIIRWFLLAFLLFFVLIIAAEWAVEEIPNYRYKKNEIEVNNRLAAAYEAKDYLEIDRICDEYDLYGLMGETESKQKEIYIQSYMLYRNYIEFCGDMLYVTQASDEEMSSDRYRLKKAVYSARDLITMQDLGLYKDLYEDNREQYELYRNEALAFLCGRLGLTEDEIYSRIDDDYMPSTKTDDLESLVRKRRGWE